MTAPDYPPLPGWYVDGAAELRWWDGTRWTASTRPRKTGPMNRELAAPTWALLPLVWATGIGWVVSMGLALAALTRHEPVQWAEALLVPGVPVLLLGQLQAVAAQRAETIRRTGTARPGPRDQLRRMRVSGRQQFLGALPVSLGRALFALFAVGWLLGMTARIGASNESLQPATATCAYPVLDRGVQSCLTAAQWGAQGADVQRFGAGIVSGFYVIGCGSALNTLVLRRRAAAAQPNGWAAMTELPA